MKDLLVNGNLRAVIYIDKAGFHMGGVKLGRGRAVAGTPATITDVPILSVPKTFKEVTYNQSTIEHPNSCVKQYHSTHLVN